MTEPFGFLAVCAFAISALTVDTVARVLPTGVQVEICTGCDVPPVVAAFRR